MEIKVEESEDISKFVVSLGFDGYSILAKIRNARYANDCDALASAIERGLDEILNEIVSSKE